LAKDPSTLTLVDGRPRQLTPVGVVVKVLDASATPSRYVLSEGHCRIGSGAGCDVVINEPTVSRIHAELKLVPEGIAVRDLGSRNGVFYLGQRIEGATLSLGAHIQLGSAKVALFPDTDALLAGGEYDGNEYLGVRGSSSALRRLFAILTRLEGSLTTVLIEGESGVGKEVIARAIHTGSRLAGSDLVTLNCGAIPRDLVASELFGHKKGAFTGATEQRRGAFQSAAGGTLFLDEVGELPLEVQPMLLRALESGEVRPVGSDRTEVFRVRVLAATNRDLGEEVRAGRFREDLFYRLAVVRVVVPPLRARPEDVEVLARLFASQVGLEDLPPEIVEQLKQRRWPGNARELRNAVHAYAALGVLPEASAPRGALLDVALDEFVDVSRPYTEQKDQLVDQFSKKYVSSLLERTGGNQTLAARVAGLDRTYLGRLLAKLGMR
jgi:transcriptional regulator with GAF, ATPase, and Fis domain